MVDLLELVRQDTGAEFARAASTRGGEHKGPCPACGGDDRFCVWPADTDHDAKPRFWCRVCGISGDLADYLEIVRNMPHIDALKAAGVIDGDGVIPSSTAASSPPRPTRKADLAEPPCVQWQRAGRAFVDAAHRYLLSAKGAAALPYLLGERGLKAETLQHYKIGYTPQSFTRPAAKWGYHKDVFCPHGIVIPCFAESALWYVKVRRPAYRRGTTEPDGLALALGHEVGFAQEAKYLSVTGGTSCALFGADDLRGDGRPLLIFEGEFDAMLAWQELGDLADVCAIKTGGRGLPANWLLTLLPYSVILVAYDVDGNQAGDRMAGAWLGQCKRARRARVPEGSDLTDFYNLGGDLRAWLAFQIDAATG